LQLPDDPTPPLKVLIIDDEEGIRRLCGTVASAAGMEVSAAGTVDEGRELARELRPDYVFLDVHLPDGNGLELLRELRVLLPAARIVMITGLSTVEAAVEAMKLGAYDYLRKPDIVPQIREILARPLKVEPPVGATGFCSLIGISRPMQEVFKLIEKAARSDSTVLIEGESGAGKELVARAIHERSARSAEPFVPVDCGAITPTLIESELFGHVSGAFTDAKSATPGLLRSAGRGTAFLDEIGELPTAVQVKLLRALQEMEVRPVGSPQTEKLDARIIAATNRDLAAEVAVGHFRRDLFYRLHVIPIFVPSLRERREDVPLLVEHFLRECGDANGREIRVTPEAMEGLMRYDWPGNVRELENFIRRAYALLDGDSLRDTDLHILFRGRPLAQPARAARPGDPGPAAAPGTPAPSHSGLLDERAAETIRQAIEQSGGNKRQAARLLGIGIATLYRKIKKYGIEA
jgi:two-component system response regulator HydG